MVRLDDLEEPVSYFSRLSMFAVMDAQLAAASKFIQEMSADLLLNTPVDDVVAQIVSNYGFDVPVIQRDQAHLEEPREVRLTIQDYGRTIHPMGTVLTLIVPFTGDAGMFWVQPTQFNHAPPRANLHHNTLILRVKGSSLDHTATAELSDLAGYQNGNYRFQSQEGAIHCSNVSARNYERSPST